MFKQSKISNYSKSKIDLSHGDKHKTHSWRKKVLERDNNQCQLCFGVVKDTFRDRKPLLEAHHIIPRRHGGQNILANGVTLCTFCHDYFDFSYTKYKLDYIEIRKRKKSEQLIKEVRKQMKKSYLHYLYNKATEVI